LANARYANRRCVDEQRCDAASLSEAIVLVRQGIMIPSGSAHRFQRFLKCSSGYWDLARRLSLGCSLMNSSREKTRATRSKNRAANEPRRTSRFPRFRKTIVACAAGPLYSRSPRASVRLNPAAIPIGNFEGTELRLKHSS